ncbi:diguanylate cyclase [Paraburkholderia tropica]|uniref:diguanylate cyclase n=1 Tax=Paraburkholderia tropica TaxID=92647 RepID=A0ABX5MSE0_9BURK|nr:diguanylate cyclase [Paraburkholderia tropica]MDE1140243.1 diguanylate cyclase [Paraburkholderia tropica]PXX18171.1 diguanylate cyclase (GGDEF)-like protein [Paraburkholderia tropica]PZW86153.1 diguanylate cyclase (GGDEF)-like protein [Paraburkholderia tropica]
MQRSAQDTANRTPVRVLSSMIMKRPHLVVTLCFGVAMLLVALVGLRQLYNMTRYDLQSRLRDLQVRAVGVDALIEAERRRLTFLRNYAEHVLAAAPEARGSMLDPAVQRALQASTQVAWQTTGEVNGPPVFGTNAATLAGLPGFHRDDVDLPGDIALARAISPLVDISQHADAVQSTVAFISTNGVFVISPEQHGMSVPALLRRFSSMNYYRGQLPDRNPSRDVLWTPVYTGLQKGEAISTLSAPIYLNDRFRGAVVMDITQSRLLSLQLATADPGDVLENAPPVEFGLLNNNGNVVYFRNGVLTEERPRRFSLALLQIARDSTGRWMQRGSGYIERRGDYLLYQRIGQTHWMLMAATDDRELTLAAARRVFSSPLIAAWAVLVLLLVGTLFIVKNIFGNYVEASGRLETLARSDPLTGLANRRRFQEAFAETVERAQRADDTRDTQDANMANAGAASDRSALAVLMLDIDYFKRVNDRYGHAAGDAVLTLLAQILRANLRGVDVPARLGGEEFAALLPGADLATASAVAERVRLAVEVHAQHLAGPASAAHPEAIPFTVSIGVAVCPADGPAHYEPLLQVADRRLYVAKESGRNRVVIADPQTLGA